MSRHNGGIFQLADKSIRLFLDNKSEVILSQVGAILGLDTSKAMIKQFEARAARVQLQDKMAGVRIELRDPKQLQVRLFAVYRFGPLVCLHEVSCFCEKTFVTFNS